MASAMGAKLRTIVIGPLTAQERRLFPLERRVRGTNLSRDSRRNNDVRTVAATALLFAALAGACSSPSDQHVATPSVPSERGVALARIPAPALKRCHGDKTLSRACPAVVPSARWRDRPEWSTERGRIVFPGAYELAAGAEHPGRPEQDRPPRLVHLVVLGGREARSLAFEWPRRRAAVAVEDGLYARDRRRALSLGERSWNGRSGDLVLAPAFPDGGIVGDHLVFRWREGGSYYAVTLHGWEPFTEVVTTLRAMVASVPG
jgi:hypothetical protein